MKIGYFWLPLIIGLTLLLAGGYYLYEIKIAKPKMAYMGVPITQNNWQNLTHVLRNKAHMVGYSEKLANPLWVTYQVTNQKQRFARRPPFSADWRSLSAIHPHEFRRSGYDRGHLAPNYVIASRHGKIAQRQTFLMTNISPQKPRFNRKIWQRLEEVSAKHFSAKFDKFWVITGPIFDDNPQRLKNTNIAIPKAFYKIFIVPATANNQVKTLAFIMPQTANPKDSLLKYVTTIDEVERQTQIDFLWQLEDDIENEIEKLLDHQPWGLTKVANLPSRY